MKVHLLILCFAPLAASVAAAATEPGAAVVQASSVLAADTAFAALSVEKGQQRAFQEYLAPDAVVFHPEPVPAREWLATHEQGAGLLDWTPVAAAVDCSGRWSVTSGPWTYTGRSGDAPAEGHYLSIWRREAGGDWRVVLDNGIDHGPSVDDGTQLRDAFSRLWPGSPVKACGAGHGAAKLQDAERDLNQSIRSEGMSKAHSRVAMTDAIAYRDDSEPRPLAEAAAADGAFGRGTEATSGFAGADPGSDLGYSYGVVVAPAAPDTAAARAAYIRIWRWDDRHWRVAIDMRTPIGSAGSP